MENNTKVTVLVLAFLIVCMAGSSSGVDLKAMDSSVNPCEDFYLYGSGTWLAKNPIPADRSSWGAGSELYERNLVILHDILEDASMNTSAATGSIVQKVGDFYRVGMDEAKIEAEGAKPLKEELNRIATLKDVAELRNEVAHLHKHGI